MPNSLRTLRCRRVNSVVKITAAWPRAFNS